MEILEAINNVCDSMNIDLRFILCSNLVLHFLLKGSVISKNWKKVISIVFMLVLGATCWLLLDMSAEKLFWSIPVALCAYDYVIKPLYNRWVAKIKADTPEVTKKSRKKKSDDESDE